MNETTNHTPVDAVDNAPINTPDDVDNPYPNGNTCIWMVAMFAAVHEKPQPNDKMTYVNLDFSTKLLWDD